MIINKYQQGGNSLPAFLDYTPVVFSEESKSSSNESSNETEDKGLTNKLIMEMVKSELDGLPSDINYISEALYNFNLDQKYGLGTSSIETQYIKILLLAKTAKFYKEQYNKALDQVILTGGINETAVDEKGNVICVIDDDIKRLNVNEFLQIKKSNPNIHALTNQELLQLRENNDKFKFDSYLISIVKNGVGMESINKLINDSIRNLGSDLFKREGYTATEQAQIKEGLEYLQKAQDLLNDQNLDENISIDGMYNMGIMTKDLAKQAKMALNYINATLPKNVKALLDIKAAENGLDSGKDIIQQLIGSRISKINTQDLSKSSSNKKDSNKSSNNSDLDILDKMKLSPVMMAQLGKTSMMPIRLLQGTKYQINVNAQVVPIVNSSGSPLGTGVSLLDVSASQYASALDFNNATMGGQLIDSSALDKVIVDSTNLYIMNLPFTIGEDGTILPDLKWLKTIENIDSIIREQKITDIDKINSLYKEAGLPVLMDSNGNLNINNYCKFGILNGKASSKTFVELDDFGIVAKEINDENLIKNYLSAVNKGKDKESKIDFDSKSLWDSISPIWNSHDSLYEGTIYLPFRDDILNGALSSNQELTVEQASIIQSRNQQRQRLAATGGYSRASMEL